MMFLKGWYVSCWGIMKTWLPFCIIMTIGLYFGTWMFAVAWAGTFFTLMAWFLTYTFLLNKKQASPQL